MWVKNINRFTMVTLVCCGIIVQGCGGGSNQLPQTTRVQGPVSYANISNVFNEQSIHNSNLKSVKSGETNACGHVLTQASDGISIVSGFINFIPVAGTALSLIGHDAATILGYIGSTEGSSCTQTEYNNFQYQLNYQESQIEALSQALKDSDNQLWSAMAASSDDIYETNANINSSYLNSITGASGYANSLMNYLGIWNSNVGGLGTNGQVAVESAMSNILNSQGGASYTDALSEVSNMSGISSAVVNLAGVSVSKSGLVTVDQGSSFILTLKSLNNAFYDNVESMDGSTNVIPIISQYNQLVNYYYVQSLLAIQQAYSLAYVINYINYANYKTSLVNSNGLPTQSTYLPDVTLGVTGSYFSPTGQTDSNCTGNTEYEITQCYNNAQETLTNVNANIINQLYLNSLNYLISDSLLPTFQQYTTSSFTAYVESSNVWESTNEVVDYANEVASLGGTPKSIINLIANSRGSTTLSTSLESLTNNLLFYQANVINVATCSNSLNSYNLVNGLNGNLKDFYTQQYESGVNQCSSALYNGVGESAIVSESTIQPYAVYNSSVLQLTGLATNNILSCNPSAVGSIPGYNLYLYTPVSGESTVGQIGKNYLMCGNWSLAGFPENGQVTYSLADTNNFFTGQQTVTNWTSPTYFNTSQNSPIYVMANNSAYWNVSAGNSTTSLEANQLNTSAPSSYYAFSNLAAIQITAPDGFIMPLGVAYTNRHNVSGNTAGLSINPNITNVQLDGQNILNTSNMAYNPGWGDSKSIFSVGNYYDPTKTIINLFPTGGFYINGNGFSLATGIATEYANGYASIDLVPISYSCDIIGSHYDIYLTEVACY